MVLGLALGPLVLALGPLVLELALGPLMLDVGWTFLANISLLNVPSGLRQPK